MYFFFYLMYFNISPLNTNPLSLTLTVLHRNTEKKDLSFNQFQRNNGKFKKGILFKLS